MSCGRPHETDCSVVLDEVYAYLDGELTPEDAEAVSAHLQECTPCLRRYGLERMVKALVARCCGCEPAPLDLRQTVLLRLAAVRVELSGPVDRR